MIGTALIVSTESIPFCVVIVFTLINHCWYLVVYTIYSSCQFGSISFTQAMLTILLYVAVTEVGIKVSTGSIEIYQQEI